eukprot:scaffold163298_cov19-Prasinocladus_malaysianus.AAC.1
MTWLRRAYTVRVRIRMFQQKSILRFFGIIFANVRTIDYCDYYPKFSSSSARWPLIPSQKDRIACKSRNFSDGADPLCLRAEKNV